MKLAYADPPYPGRAHLYEGHPGYAGEVDHDALIRDLREYDGWALSTSADALPQVLDSCLQWHCRRFRTLAWVKHTVTVSWEPVIVVPARKPEGVRDWIQAEPDAFQWRERPDTHVIGAKPEAFCLWMFAWLGAQPEDEFDDMFPGSGAVARAWEKWRQQPALPIARSPQAEKRAGRRALERQLDAHPTIGDAA